MGLSGAKAFRLESGKRHEPGADRILWHEIKDLLNLFAKAPPPGHWRRQKNLGNQAEQARVGNGYVFAFVGHEAEALV